MAKTPKTANDNDGTDADAQGDLRARLTTVIEALDHQIKHNAPVLPHHVKELAAIRDELD